MFLPIPPWNGLPGVFGISSRSVGLGPLEVHGGADLLDSGSMSTLDDLLLHPLGLLDRPHWGLLGRLGGRGRIIGGFLLFAAGRLLGDGLLSLGFD